MANSARTPGELSGIEVERLDAVDKPATYRRWLIMKGEGANTMDPKALETAALALMENLAKDAGADGLAMSEGSLGSINGLAKALGLATAFKAKAAPPVPPPPPAANPLQDPEKDPFACRLAKMEEGLSNVTKSISDLVAKMAPAAPAAPAPAAPAPAIAPTPVAKSVDGGAPPASTQVQGQDATRRATVPEMGKGMFTNVIFAAPTVVGR